MSLGATVKVKRAGYSSAMPLFRSPSLPSVLQSYSKSSSAAIPTFICRRCIHQHNLNHRPTDSSRPVQAPQIFARHRPFSSTPTARLADHYATLDLPPSASQADIKKAFYTLSKTHHPDRNPHNQEEASEKFVACSDAYAVLGNPAKRQAYDRERTPASARGVQPQAGSYSSAQAGGRPASGLSRRRSAFRGPPPSFYRNGGWGAGATAEKRRANNYADGSAERQRQEDNLNGEDSFARQQQGGGAGARGHVGGDEAGQDGFPFSAPNDVPHFDRSGHFRRTTSVEEQLRRGRTKRRKVLLEEQAEALEEVGAGTEFRSFALIGGVILVGVGMPVLLYGMGGAAETKKSRS